MQRRLHRKVHARAGHGAGRAGADVVVLITTMDTAAIVVADHAP